MGRKVVPSSEFYWWIYDSLHIIFSRERINFFYQKEDRITYKDSETEMNLLCSRQRKRPVWLIQYVYLNSSMCYLPEYYWLSVVSVLTFVKVKVNACSWTHAMRGDSQTARFQINFLTWKQKTYLCSYRETWNPKYESPFKKRNSFN